MIVRNQRQALSVAVEMEARAIRTYERALMLAKRPEVLEGIRIILDDERVHHRRFMEMRGEMEENPAEDRLLTGALAEEALFPGGAMEMARAQGLTSLRGLYEFAADSEADAVENYQAFAARCEDEAVAQAFQSIALEEAKHLTELRWALKHLPKEDE